MLYYERLSELIADVNETKEGMIVAMEVYKDMQDDYHMYIDTPKEEWRQMPYAYQYLLKNTRVFEAMSYQLNAYKECLKAQVQKVSQFLELDSEEYMIGME